MFSSLVFPVLFFLTMAGRTTGQILSCFYEIENFNVSIIEPSLCTHIILIGSSNVDNIGHFQEPPSNVTEEFVKLKNRAPVKLLLAVTGNSAHFTTLVSSEATMQQFADESLAYLDRSGIDGIDIDWEFPVWSWGAKKSDRTRFGDLLRILRQKYGTKKLITVDVAGPPTIAKYSYQADYLNKYADFVQIMSYDYHVYDPILNPVVGFNSPLRRLPYERGILAKMNSDSSLSTYISMGLWKNKTVFGIPTYGYAYTLFNAFINEPYSLATGSKGAVTYSMVRNSY
ncbi:hypothetical protein WR25_07407 isoform E [Diploscapter pachys]|uniref:GH18 domain-containing protein n=1 Tax=Diploscapter pachys TaxID=2018661 RepID=A0A2A2KR19_9BILA|nr:hypothetical protein WR25_07407 isoform E [Diploscapter pachys]